MDQHILIYFIARQLANLTPFINDEKELNELYEREVTIPIHRSVLFHYFTILNDPFGINCANRLHDLPTPLHSEPMRHSVHIELLATLLARKLITTYTDSSYNRCTNDDALQRIQEKLQTNDKPPAKLKDGEVDFVCDRCGSRSLVVCYDATVRRYTDEMSCATEPDGTQYFNYTHDYGMDPDVDTFDVLFFECDGCKKTWESEDELMESGCLKNVEPKDNGTPT